MVDSLSFNGNLKGPSGKSQHQWTAPPPQSKTGGPNWQAPPTSRTSLPQAGMQPGGFIGQPGMQPAGFRPPFATQPMGQPFMVGEIKTGLNINMYILSTVLYIFLMVLVGRIYLYRKDHKIKSLGIISFILVTCWF